MPCLHHTYIIVPHIRNANLRSTDPDFQMDTPFYKKLVQVVCYRKFPVELICTHLNESKNFVCKLSTKHLPGINVAVPGSENYKYISK